MAEIAAGSQTATIGTEHTLATATTFGTYVLLVDVSAMVNDDVLELRVKAKARAAEANVKEIYRPTLKHAQVFPIVASIPVLCSAVEFTLKQTAGTGRAFPWSVNFA
jgi:hypothetical protein